MKTSNLNHLAIILDGNGRWATAQKKSRTFGHEQGLNKIHDVILWAKEFDIKHITLFCFSTENWNRPKQEVKFLVEFPQKGFNEKRIKEYIKNDIKVNWIGRRSKVPEECKNVIESLEQKTKDCKSIKFNLAFDYGSFDEVLNTFKIIYKKINDNDTDINNLNFEDIEKNLYTKNSPPVDFLIRTGGEQRLSNFLLLQCAYAELYFTKTYWPAFEKKDFEAAIKEFKSRNRRFGEIKE
ncbi:polyprenyl diphosphate synthase [Spiroplasma tabanidicola]|uniref:Isoprenyl transferase n=1 Tax=Spiroplasma tabanidicola TaxID=324079 RepID=A0A6I6C5I8_9MOLU|nr:polyprenyl diphosphate synthase [Spiroplasma tabanidicola]QGS52117.1 undecaprenyl diphosphate synthase [Spiroplasma tabanidicola]